MVGGTQFLCTRPHLDFNVVRLVLPMSIRIIDIKCIECPHLSFINLVAIGIGMDKSTNRFSSQWHDQWNLWLRLRYLYSVTYSSHMLISLLTHVFECRVFWCARGTCKLWRTNINNGREKRKRCNAWCFDAARHQHAVSHFPVACECRLALPTNDVYGRRRMQVPICWMFMRMGRTAKDWWLDANKNCAIVRRASCIVRVRTNY